MTHRAVTIRQHLYYLAEVAVAFMLFTFPFVASWILEGLGWLNLPHP